MNKTISETHDTQLPVEPPPYLVIYLNDQITTFTFVIESLIRFFDYGIDEADAMATIIDATGRCAVATLPHGIAEQRAQQVEAAARAEGYPLRLIIMAEY